MESDVNNAITLNLMTACRACLSESQVMHSIFDKLADEGGEEDVPFVHEILADVSSIKISDQRLPAMICVTCLELAIVAYKFKRQCDRSQILLESYVAQNVVAMDVAEERTQGEKEDGPMLDAAQVASSPENLKLKEKLTAKKMLSSTFNTDARREGLEKQKRRSSFSYYVKEISPGEKVYACDYCDKSYKYSSSLKIHLRLHTSERPYVCKVCGKSFAQYGSLMYHHRSHTGEQPYSCKICGKKYKQSGTLTAHMRIHTGQRPFLCSVCGRGFRQAPDLSYHMRTHTKEKPYMCSVCGKTMSMQCHLVQHMRTHTGERPFKCIECNKAFPSSTRLKRHAIIHTGLKPHKCEVCNKTFNRRSSLVVHSKIHTDDRRHSCPVCGKGFIQAHAMRGHLLTHSADNVSNAKSE